VIAAWPVLWIIAAAAYVGAAAAYARLLFGPAGGRRPALGLLAAALVAHLGWLAAVSARLGRLPIGDPLETLLLAGWLCVAVCLMVDARWRAPALGIFAAPLGLVSILALLARGAPAAVPASELNNPWLQLHIVLILIGYAALALAFGSAVVYLVQDRGLRSKHPSALGRHLPSVQAADDTAYRLVAVGFPLLTAGLVVGVLMLQQMKGVYWLWDDIKLTMSAVTWLVFAVYLHARMAQGWKGRRTAVLLVIGFVLVLVTYLGVWFLAPDSWHNAPFGSTARG